MRVILSGGGTGGHIYPAITIARALSNALADKEACEILFVGTKEGLEADIIPKEGFTFTTIEIQGFARKISLKNVQAFGKIITGLWQSRRIISQFRPDIVIGTGGYVCGPVLLAASLMGIKTIIQEQNVVAGITNKILAKFVQKIAVGYPEAKEYFGKNQTKVIVTGNPIRAEIVAATREQGIKELGLDPAKQTLLVAGGSCGAHSINQAMPQVYEYFAGRQDIQIVHVTGQADYQNMLESIEKSRMELLSVGNIIIKPYLYNMPLALAAADLAIFRAGAIGLAELTARGIPAILIPYPYAAENHQEYNARVMENYGAAIVISDSQTNGSKLIENIELVLKDPVRKASMAKTSALLGRPEAAQNITRLTIGLLKTEK